MPNSENVMRLGYVETFPGARPTKEQALKVVEEAAEVFGAWQAWDAVGYDGATADEDEAWRHLVGECADVVQAVSNLLYALGVEDFRPQMALCAARNRERGRM